MPKGAAGGARLSPLTPPVRAPAADASEAAAARQRVREREGGQREIGARQPGRWQSEEEPEESADCHDRGHGDIERQPLVGEQDARGVSADGKEGAVAPRDLPAGADRQLQASHGQRQDQHAR